MSLSYADYDTQTQPPTEGECMTHGYGDEENSSAIETLAGIFVFVALVTPVAITAVFLQTKKAVEFIVGYAIECLMVLLGAGLYVTGFLFLKWAIQNPPDWYWRPANASPLEETSTIVIFMILWLSAVWFFIITALVLRKLAHILVDSSKSWAVRRRLRHENRVSMFREF